ncbi:hypothetical protein ACFL2I_05625 [Candidatus Omnitrophota bacterium]
MERKKIVTSISGIVTGGLFVAIVMGSGLFAYKATNRMIDFVDITERQWDKEVSAIAKQFRLSFERPEELKIFRAQDSGVEISRQFATKGDHSLLVEFPPQKKYPGISFDLSGQECLDWSRMKEFSFDTFNIVNKSKVLIVQIRSGDKYPKREFKKEFTLPALEKSTISISREELAKKLDLNKVSHLTIFMVKPKTTFRVFFDNMRID